MHLLQLAFAAAAWLNAAFWIIQVGVSLRSRWGARELRDLPSAQESYGRRLPRLAVIVPSLNEEAGIRAALESLASLDYPDFLILPIDDRSTDRTGAIMDEVAARNPHVDPIHIESLPPGWIGKNHANQRGYLRAKERGAQWLLFTDGDVQFSPTALRKAMSYIDERGLHHLAVAPELIPGGFWETTFVTAFVVWFTTRFQTWKAEDPNSKRFVGIGAFNLIRIDAYEAIGGHETLALTVVDDMALGKLVKEAGFRQGFLRGDGEVRVRWQSGLGASVRGLYKNSFATLDFSWAKVVGSTLFVFVSNVLVYALPFLTSGQTRIAAWVGLAGTAGVYAWAARTLGRSIGVAAATGLCGWFGGGLFVWVPIASAALTQRQGGVIWRGTLYPIRMLKGNQVRV